MAYRQTVVLKWIDGTGATRTQTLTTLDNPAPSFGTVSAYLAAVAAASDAGLMLAKMCPIDVVGGDPESGPYPTVKDVALCIFRTTAGTTIRVTIPGPKEAIFKDDLQTVDPEAPLMVTIIAAVIGAISDANGNTVTTFVSGSRQFQRVPPIVGP